MPNWYSGFLHGGAERLPWQWNALRLALFPGVALALASPVGAQDVPVRRMVGELVVTGFLGSTTGHPWFAEIVKQVERGEIGGTLFLRRNVGSPSDLIALNEALAAAGGSGPAPLSCIDEEGGQVSRLRILSGFPRPPSARKVGREFSGAEALVAYRRMARGIADLGFNCNLAPVVDVDVNPRSPAVGAAERSFSRDPADIVRFAKVFVEAHRENGIVTALKHFPGHGSAAQDSHDSLPDISRSWTEEELFPYRQLLAAQAETMVMTGHLVHRGLDNTGAPATLSAPITTGLLREELGWDGIVMTDDLQMTPVARRLPPEAAAIEAIRAGADIVLFANDEKPELDLPARLATLAEAEARRSPQFRERLEEAYRRVVALKLRLADFRGKPGR